jgi:hypothetical protein
MFVKPTKAAVDVGTALARDDLAADVRAVLEKGLHVVREPWTHRVLPPEGREVPEDQFWMQRLRDGDVELAEPPHGPPAA